LGQGAIESDLGKEDNKIKPSFNEIKILQDLKHFDLVGRTIEFFFFSINNIVLKIFLDFQKLKAVLFRCFKKPCLKYLNLVLTRKRLLIMTSRNLIKINFLL
jgi:hypothetical protein